jgi:hypothetical protein
VRLELQPVVRALAARELEAAVLVRVGPQVPVRV